MRFLVTAGIVPEGIEQLRRYGEVNYSYFGEKLQMLAGKKLVSSLAGVEVFITEIDPLNARVLEEAPDLKCVASCRGNPVNIDVAACTKRGIPVIHAPGRNADAVADLAVCLMLMLARKIPDAMSLLHEDDKSGPLNMKMARAFTQLKGMELWEKTVGLIGLGAVGRSVAARLRPFGCKILAYDPYADAEVSRALDVDLTGLDEVLSQSDFISMHAAVTPETEGMIGPDEVRKMKKGAYFINTARAALADEEALARALESGHLSGAAFDVFSKEPPPPDHPLIRLANVISLPHIGGNTEQIPKHQTRIVIGDIIRWLEGKKPRNLANPEVWRE